MKSVLVVAAWLAVIVAVVSVAVVLAAFVSVVAERVRRRRATVELEAIAAGVEPPTKRRKCPVCSGRGHVHRVLAFALKAWLVIAVTDVVLRGAANVLEAIR